MLILLINNVNHIKNVINMKPKTVEFNFSLNYNEVIKDRNQYDLRKININGLKKIAKGHIFGFFYPPRKYMKLGEVALVGYILEFCIVIDAIELGYFNPFSVSKLDWFTASLGYVFDAETGFLTITEANGGEFTIVTEFAVFKKEVIKFYNSTMSELSLIYPELNDNTAFNKIRIYDNVEFNKIGAYENIGADIYSPLND
jgi:hypothetical protein